MAFNDNHTLYTTLFLKNRRQKHAKLGGRAGRDRSWGFLSTFIYQRSEAVCGMLMQLLVQRKRFTTNISVIFGV